jgi:hypothetical protein
MNRYESAMTEIERSWEQWQSPNAEVMAKDGWRPCDDLATRPLDIDGAIRRSYRLTDTAIAYGGTHWQFTDSPVPRWRKLVRWLSILIS